MFIQQEAEHCAKCLWTRQWESQISHELLQGVLTGGLLNMPSDVHRQNAVTMQHCCLQSQCAQDWGFKAQVQTPNCLVRSLGDLGPGILSHNLPRKVAVRM